MLINNFKKKGLLFFNFFFLFLIYFIRDSFKFNSLVIIFYFMAFYSFFDLKINTGLINIYEKIKTKKNLIYFFLFIIIFFTIIFQNTLINYETIDWDVSTYLVVGNDISNGNLPYEQQWDDKGPVLYFFFYFLSLLSNKNFLLFKILSDLVVVIIAINLFYLIYLLIKKENITTPLAGSVIYVLMMALPWANVEYSEVYSLFFLSFSLVIFYMNKNLKKNILLSGLFFGLSTLTNQGSGIFVIAFLLVIYFNKKQIKDAICFSIGTSLPHIFFLALYLINDAIDIYFTTLYKIPLSYSSSTSFNLFVEFKNFIRDLYSFNIFFFIIIAYLFTIKVFEYRSYFFGEKQKIKYENDLFIIGSFLFYLLASTGYKHHLLFFFFFISASVVSVDGLRAEIILFLIISVCTFSIFPSYFQDSKNNLTQIDELYEGYPLRKAATVIENNIAGNKFTVLALDYQILNYYLDKPNLSKVIHPTNYGEESILQELKNIGFINNDEISSILIRNPDVIICSPLTKEIINDFNCEVNDYLQNYRKLDLEIYFNDPNRSYYKDVYRSLNVFIKTDS